MVNYNSIILMGFTIIVIGFLLIFIGTALKSTNESSQIDIKTGGVVFIGPIPIIFGNDRGLTIFAVIFAVILMIISYFLFYRGSI